MSWRSFFASRSVFACITPLLCQWRKDAAERKHHSPSAHGCPPLPIPPSCPFIVSKPHAPSIHASFLSPKKVSLKSVNGFSSSLPAFRLPLSAISVLPALSPLCASAIYSHPHKNACSYVCTACLANGISVPSFSSQTSPTGPFPLSPSSPFPSSFYLSTPKPTRYASSSRPWASLPRSSPGRGATPAPPPRHGPG